MVDLARIAPLFEGWEETMIWSCLQGVMGVAQANGDYTAGLITSRDFSFLAGRPDPALLEKVTAPIVAPRTEDWRPLIEERWGRRAVRELRYAFHKDPGGFDREKLEALAAAIPGEYELRMIDGPLVSVLLAEDWSRDFCAAFDSPEDFCRRGIGVAAMYEGVPVAGAGSYIVYRGGIEIEIDTRKDHRGKGLATACGAKLILECLDRGLYPSWDAIDLRSAALAEKLGYRPAGPYAVYWIGRPAAL